MILETLFLDILEDKPQDMNDKLTEDGITQVVDVDNKSMR